MSESNESAEVPKKPRIYPRRQLRGPVEVHHSIRLKFPKFHMVADCDGLERTPEEARGVKHYESARALGLDMSGRPCRNCTLESTLITALHPRFFDSSEKKVFVTSTSQANPLDPGAKIYSYKWRESSASGKERLLRLAKKTGLEVTSSAVGPVMFGFVPASSALILSHNLRTMTRSDISEMPSPEVVECVWTFLGDNPPELGLNSDSLDPWELALMLG